MPPKTPKKAPKPAPAEAPPSDAPVTDPKQRRILELQRVYMRIVTFAIFGGILIGGVAASAEAYFRPTTFSKPLLRTKVWEIGNKLPWLLAFVFASVMGLIYLIDAWAIPRLSALVEGGEAEPNSKKTK